MEEEDADIKVVSVPDTGTDEEKYLQVHKRLLHRALDKRAAQSWSEVVTQDKNFLHAISCAHTSTQLPARANTPRMFVLCTDALWDQDTTNLETTINPHATTLPHLRRASGTLYSSDNQHPFQHLTIRLSSNDVNDDDIMHEIKTFLQLQCKHGGKLRSVVSLECVGVASADVLLACVSLLPSLRRVNLASAYPLSDVVARLSLCARGLEELHWSLYPAPLFLRHTSDMEPEHNPRRPGHVTLRLRSEKARDVPTFLDSVCSVMVTTCTAHPQAAPRRLPNVMGANTHQVRLLELHHCMELRAVGVMRLLDTTSLEHIAVRHYPGSALFHARSHPEWDRALVKHPWRQHKPSVVLKQSRSGGVSESEMTRLKQQVSVDAWSEDTFTILWSRVVGGICSLERQGRLPFFYQDLIAGVGVYTGRTRFPSPWLPGVWLETDDTDNEHTPCGVVATETDTY
jgi:hypothetical protein